MSASSNGALPKALRTAFERGGEMGRRMLALDEQSSPLGLPRDWPPELQHAVGTMLASRAQIVIFYGPDYCALYNDSYVPTMGSKHPGYLGRPGREMWAEAWSVLQDLFDGVVNTDEAFWASDYLFMIERFGFLEETYFDISYDPIRTADGSVGGVFCIVTETTGRVLNERRVRTLSALGSRLADPSDQAGLGARVAQVLGENAADVPFAALYLDDPDGGGELTLAGSAGAPPEALIALGPRGRSTVEAVLRTGHPDRLPVDAVCHPAPLRAAGESLVLPVGVGTTNVGVLVVGVSRHLSLDRDYSDYSPKCLEG